MKKISIIMPTFNDSETIEETLNSIFEQTYKNWELIIVDDGSTDNTKNIISEYKEKNDKENRVKYIYQENADQLNAILNGLDYIKGDYVYICHSDDLINEIDTFKKCIEYMEKNINCDAIIGDLVLIDEKAKITGKQIVKNYEKKKYILPLQQLWLGRNLFVDVAFYRKKFFENNVKNSYLTWNTPFWIKQNIDNIEMANINKVDFSIMRYRISEGNYINNEIGKLNVMNGELRTLVTLMNYYNIPLYKIQFYIFRLFNKLKLEYRPIYQNKQQKNKDKIIEFVIRKRFTNEYKSNMYLNSLVAFYKNKNDRTIEINEEIDNNEIYKGKDVRTFSKKLIDNKLAKFYYIIFNEMKTGFNKILVENEKEKEKMHNICKFLCIDPKIEIK